MIDKSVRKENIKFMTVEKHSLVAESTGRNFDSVFWFSRARINAEDPLRFIENSSVMLSRWKIIILARNIALRQSIGTFRALMNLTIIFCCEKEICLQNSDPELSKQAYQ